MISISKNVNTVPWKYAVEDLNDGLAGTFYETRVTKNKSNRF